jgi:hypothetical protein
MGRGAKPRDQPSSMKISMGPERVRGVGDRSPKPECWDLSNDGRSTVLFGDWLMALTESMIEDKSEVSWVPGGPRPCSSALSG